MLVTVNAEKKNIEADSVSITRLLVLENVTIPDMVSVQLNGAFVDRSVFDSTYVNENDEIEFLYFMGGGQ